MAQMPKYHARLAAAYRAAYTHKGAEHTAGHARLHPEEEFIPYLLHVVCACPWPAHHLYIMAESQASEVKCVPCKYRAGHGKLLTARDEVRLIDKSSECLFLRKVV